MTRKSKPYDPEYVALITRALEQWRRGDRPTGREGTELGVFIQDMAHRRWVTHFPSSWRHNWVGYEEIRYQIVVALIEYLLTPASRIIYPNQYKACSINKEWHSLQYTLTEFRLQFARVVTCLQADNIGVNMLPEYGSNVPLRVRSCEYQSLHHCCLLLRTYTTSVATPNAVDYTSYVIAARNSKCHNVIDRYIKCAAIAWMIYQARNTHHIDSTIHV